MVNAVVWTAARLDTTGTFGVSAQAARRRTAMAERRI